MKSERVLDCSYLMLHTSDIKRYHHVKDIHYS